MTRQNDAEIAMDQSNDSPKNPLPMSTTRRTLMKSMAAGAAGSLIAGNMAMAQDDATPEMDDAGEVAGPGSDSSKPNILVIMGDDIGYWNISAYNMGMMGYRTPNIDRIAQEGTVFTDAYGEQSCTAGRGAFITGQHPYRSGLIRIGRPGEDHGLHEDDPTLAQVLKGEGYATAQFGKNHLGDMNKYLPTVHGFDEFYGNLYHLNAEDEPEHPDYPEDPAFAEHFGPRGLVHSWATEEDDPTEDPRFGRVGKQVIEAKGPLSKERQKSIDGELLEASMGFIENAAQEDTPFFLWFCPTRMHIFTHLSDEADGVTGLGIQADGMVEHDGHVGQLLNQLDELGIADNTIVIYTTENGAQLFTWPDGNMTPFRGEKNSNWEGAYRIPMMVRWPNEIPAGTISNDIVSLQDWMPTLAAAAGQPHVKEQLLEGYQIGDKSFTAHLDGYNLLPHLTEGEPSARHEFFYFMDTGSMVGLRLDRWKFVTQEQHAVGIDIWLQPFDELRGSKIVDLRGDPFERAMVESGNYDNWMLERLFLMHMVREATIAFQSTFLAFPPRTDA